MPTISPSTNTFPKARAAPASFFSPKRIEHNAAPPTPRSVPTAAERFITGNEIANAANAYSPTHCPMKMLSTTL